jgi:DNA replication licensing factor MCM2
MSSSNHSASIAALFGDETQDIVAEEDEGEDLFGDDMERDYRPQPELDILSASGIDDRSDFDNISVGARRAAEREMDERDNLMGDEGAVRFSYKLISTSFSVVV